METDLNTIDFLKNLLNIMGVTMQIYNNNARWHHVYKTPFYF